MSFTHLSVQFLWNAVGVKIGQRQRKYDIHEIIDALALHAKRKLMSYCNRVNARARWSLDGYRVITIRKPIDRNHYSPYSILRFSFDQLAQGISHFNYGYSR